MSELFCIVHARKGNRRSFRYRKITEALPSDWAFRCSTLNTKTLLHIYSKVMTSWIPKPNLHTESNLGGWIHAKNVRGYMDSIIFGFCTLVLSRCGAVQQRDAQRYCDG